MTTDLLDLNDHKNKKIYTYKNNASLDKLVAVKTTFNTIK